MIAASLISNLVEPVQTSDSGEEVILIMKLNHIKHLPIVDGKEFLGMISEEEILSNDLEEKIGNYGLSFTRPYAYENEHLFEVMSKMAHNNLTVIPVIADNDDYVGLITQSDLLQYYASSFSFKEPGSIIIIETEKRQYSLAEISRIIESENASILSSFLTSEKDSVTITVTLKVNRQEISNIISALNRYDYVVKGSFSEQEYIDELKERYDSLMTYLNV